MLIFEPRIEKSLFFVVHDILIFLSIFVLNYRIYKCYRSKILAGKVLDVLPRLVVPKLLSEIFPLWIGAVSTKLFM